MGNAEGDNHKNGHHGVSFWIALVRGVLIVGLGLSLILIPEQRSVPGGPGAAPGGVRIVAEARTR